MRSLAIAVALVAATTAWTPQANASIKLDGGIVGALRGGFTGSFRGLVRVRRATAPSGKQSYRIRPLPGAILWGVVGAGALILGGPHVAAYAQQFATHIGFGLQNAPLYVQGAAAGAAIRFAVGTKWGLVRGLFRGAQGETALIDDLN